jgi:hypothetical protein
MSAKPVSTCSALSHASTIFAYVPSRLGVNVKKKERMTWLNLLLH